MTGDHMTPRSAVQAPPQDQADAPGFTKPGSTVTVANVEDFKAVYLAERSLLARYLISQGADPHEADEAVQATFVQALAVWQSIRNPRAWLFKVAQREFFKANVRVRVRETPAGPAVFDTIETLASGDLAQLSEEEEIVRAAVEALPPRQREVMSRHYAGFKDSEIAEELGCTHAAVRQNLLRASDNLAQHLGLTRRKTR